MIGNTTMQNLTHSRTGTPWLRSVAALLLACGLSIPLAHAAAPGDPEAKALKAEDQSTSRPQGDRSGAIKITNLENAMMNIDVPQGVSIGAAFKALESQASQPVNIVLSLSAERIREVPCRGFSLRMVSAPTVVDLLVWTANQAAEAEDSPATTYSISAKGGRSQNEAVVLTIAADDAGIADQRGPTTAPSQSVEYFPINDLMEALKAVDDKAEPRETLLSTMELGLESISRNGAPRPQLSLHKESGLLIARGNVKQLAVIRAALNAVAANIEAKRSALVEAQARQQQIESLSHRLKSTEALHDKLRMTLQELDKSPENKSSQERESIRLKLAAVEEQGRDAAQRLAELEAAPPRIPKPQVRTSAPDADVLVASMREEIAALKAEINQLRKIAPKNPSGR